jgi:hypothetical protein
MPANIGKII